MSQIPQWARDARSSWQYTGARRPAFAYETAPGQESVWDYPRPPRIDPDSREVIVRAGDTVIAETRSAVRILETAGPPTFYLPPADVRTDLLEVADQTSACEWKGIARYWTLTLPQQRLQAVAWSYPDPFPGYERIKDYISVYPGRLACFVAGIRVTPQPGGTYGGWVTPEVVGPFKGDPGSEGW